MTAEILSAGISGFLLGASLIIAIGAQNAFILRQGLLREHVFILCLVCALADALLITAGVAGFGAVIARSGMLILAVKWAGAVFLFVYGCLALKRAWRPDTLTVTKDGGTPLAAAIAACLSFTFLNPHVYLDTVVLLGGISGQYDGEARLAFGIGAVLASFVWFYVLGYGARLLQPLFAKPVAWRILDGIIALIMFALAVSLVA